MIHFEIIVSMKYVCVNVRVYMVQVHMKMCMYAQSCLPPSFSTLVFETAPSPPGAQQ